MDIRPLLADDVPRYRELMLRGYEESPDAFTSTVEERAREPMTYWVQRIAAPSGLRVGFGAFAGDALVGAVALELSAKPKTAHSALLIGMYVLPDHRRTGAGRALLSALIEHCGRQPGVCVLRLTVTEGNDSAIRLYENAGFRSFGTEPLAMLGTRGYIGKVHMWRPIPGEKR